MTKKRQSFFLDDDRKRRLKRLSKRTRVPFSEYIREGIDMVLRRYKEKRR